MTESANLALEGLQTGSAGKMELQKLRLDFLNAFHVAFKGARFFPPQNESVISKIEQLFEIMKKLCVQDGACNIENIHSFLMLNGTRIKTDVAGLVSYNFIMEIMNKLKVGTLSFEPTITFEELRSFLYVFAKLDPNDSREDSFTLFNEELKRIGMTTVTVLKLDAQDLSAYNEGLRLLSVDTYFRSISVAKNILKNAHAGKAVNFRKAKRAVQTMVDIAEKDEFFLLSLSTIKNYDEYTYNHSTNVAVLCITFGQQLNLGKQLLSSVGMASLLHDVGKTDIDKDVLNKSGKLNRDEWEMLKSHPIMGVRRLLKTAELNEMLIRSIIVAFQHHKRIDLKGYPDTVSQRELNLLSKIVAIADCYDALTTPRVYRKKSYSAAEAFSIMLDDAGTVFDPTLLNKFALFLSLYPVGTLLELDTGEMALVYRVRHELETLDRPSVKLVTDCDGNKIEPMLIDLNDKDENGNYLRNTVNICPPDKHFENLDDYFALL